MGAGSPDGAAPEGDVSDAGEIVARSRRAIVPSFDFRLDFCAATARGSGRNVNQDAVLCRPDAALFAIADGMGGHAAGEIASGAALEALGHFLEAAEAREVVERYADEPELEHRRAIFELLTRAMNAANDHVVKVAAQQRERKGMGTTLDMVLLVRDRAFFAHVGDARAYLVRPTATLQLTHDHAAFDSLRSSGKRTPGRGRPSPLTNSIGHSSRLTVDTLFVDLSAGDRIVLCTDGIFNNLDSEATFARVARRGEPPVVTQNLLRLAKKSGSTDDASVVAIEVGRRFASRRVDAGPRAQDMATIAASPLLAGLPPSDLLAALAAGVEVDIPRGKEIPCAVASDRVAYVVLDGLVSLPDGRQLGASGLVMVESLLDIPVRGQLPVVVERARLLRIRHDDFNEVCAHNTTLAVELYKRVAKHLATSHG
ncbi:MAG: protein phosphatase 2C domain-containing protein [Myxococcales bacterium]|nr:protein phosphatase 2C domain-containing protein [Myxococcales bacterium]